MKAKKLISIFLFLILSSWQVFAAPSCSNSQSLPKGSILHPNRREVYTIKREIVEALQGKILYSEATTLRKRLSYIGVRGVTFLKTIHHMVDDDDDAERDIKIKYVLQSIFCNSKSEYNPLVKVAKQLKHMVAIADVPFEEDACSSSRAKRFVRNLFPSQVKSVFSKIKRKLAAINRRFIAPAFHRLFFPLRYLKRKIFRKRYKRPTELHKNNLETFYDLLAIKKKKFQDKNPGKKFPLAEFMKKNGYETVFRDIDLRKPGYSLNYPGNLMPIGMVKTDLLSDIDYTGIRFIRVKADEINFSGSIFTDDPRKPLNSTFKRSSFINASFEDAQFRNVKVNGGSFHNADFNDAHFKRTRFLSVNMRGTTFDDSQIPDGDKVVFDGCRMDYSSFYGVERNKVEILSSYGTPINPQNVFFKRSTFKRTTPVVGMTWNPRDNGFSVPRVKETIDSSGDMLISKTSLTFKGISRTSVENEFVRLIQDCKENPIDAKTSRAKCVVIRGQNKDEYPVISKLLKKARRKTKEMDTVILTGGENVDPRFYDGRFSPNAGAKYNLLRDIYEMGVIYQTQEDRIPVVGICRGFQLYNIYEGGKAKFIDSRYRFKKGFFPVTKVSDPPDGSPLTHINGRQIFVHSQYISKRGKGLKTTHTYTSGSGRKATKVPSAMYHKKYPVTLNQFHGEFYSQLDKEHGFVVRKYFEQMVNTRQRRYWLEVNRQAREFARNRPRDEDT